MISDLKVLLSEELTHKVFWFLFVGLFESPCDIVLLLIMHVQFLQFNFTFDYQHINDTRISNLVTKVYFSILNKRTMDFCTYMSSLFKFCPQILIEFSFSLLSDHILRHYIGYVSHELPIQRSAFPPSFTDVL